MSGCGGGEGKWLWTALTRFNFLDLVFDWTVTVVVIKMVAKGVVGVEHKTKLLCSLFVKAYVVSVDEFWSGKLFNPLFAIE